MSSSQSQPVLTPKSAIGDIIAKLEKASGPDRDIDALIATSVCGYVFEKRGRDQKPWYYPNADNNHDRKSLDDPGFWRLPDWTRSLDASLALVESQLPRRGLQIMTDSGVWRAVISPHEDMFEGMSTSPAVALLIALFRALDDGASSRPTGQLREAK